MVENPPTKLRILIDANILFAGVIWPRFPYEVLNHALRGDYELVLTPAIVLEARKAVANYDPFWLESLDNFLSECPYEDFPTPAVEEIEQHFGLVRDEKDVHVALAAINAKVDYLVSQDRDLTDPAEPIHEKLKILLPAAFLRHHMGWSSDDLEAIRHRTWDELSDEE